MQEICEICERVAKTQMYTTLESDRPQNRGLNRYRDVNPYDHSRIVLKRGTIDYINANLVKVSVCYMRSQLMNHLSNIVSFNPFQKQSTAGPCRSSIYTDTGSAAGYGGSLLVDGLGAKLARDSNAQQAEGEEAG